MLKMFRCTRFNALSLPFKILYYQDEQYGQVCTLPSSVAIWNNCKHSWCLARLENIIWTTSFLVWLFCVQVILPIQSKMLLHWISPILTLIDFLMLFEFTLLFNVCLQNSYLCKSKSTSSLLSLNTQVKCVLLSSTCWRSLFTRLLWFPLSAWELSDK